MKQARELTTSHDEELGTALPIRPQERDRAEGRRKPPRGAVRSVLPSRVTCSLPTLVHDVPTEENWIHENKLDGYRIIAIKDGRKVTLQSRNFKDWTDRFPVVAAALASLPEERVILDGEIVVFHADGTTDFQALQNSMKSEGAARARYVAFDVLYRGNHDLRDVPLRHRKEVLRDVFEYNRDPRLLMGSYAVGQGGSLWERACQMGLEGLVSKSADAAYSPGRTFDWLKVKCMRTEEFVIGGYTEPAGSRSDFGALLLGYYDSKDNLVYCGSVGTGFDQSDLSALGEHLRARETEESPFCEPPRRSQRAALHWVTPTLIAQIRYLEWTREGYLRQPAFLGLREDKAPKSVGRDRARASKDNENTVAGIRLSNPDRILYEAQGLTKREIASYYENLADWILPYVVHRPISVVRCPKGRDEKCFFQKHPRETLGPPIHSIPIQEKSGKRPYIVIENLSGLIALVQYGVLEIHAWGAGAEDLEHPDQMVFDLDPGPGVDWSTLIEGARILRNHLMELGLTSFPRTSGGKGLHLVVPILPDLTWEEVKNYSRDLSRMLARVYPARFVAEMSKEKRKGKIFIDYLRNGRGATSIACYSTRARPNAPVCTPVSWAEVNPRLSPDKFHVRNIRRRLTNLREDPWKDFFDTAQCPDPDELSRMIAARGGG